MDSGGNNVWTTCHISWSVIAVVTVNQPRWIALALRMMCSQSLQIAKVAPWHFLWWSPKRREDTRRIIQLWSPSDAGQGPLPMLWECGVVVDHFLRQLLPMPLVEWKVVWDQSLCHRRTGHSAFLGDHGIQNDWGYPGSGWGWIDRPEAQLVR